MNELGIRKLPRDDDGPDPDKVIYSDKLEPSDNITVCYITVSELSLDILCVKRRAQRY
jgi:hypothetical protein